jgi:hypothetical protein
MKSDFPERLEKARTLPDIFEIVKDAIRKGLGRSRGGLMLAIADLGNHPSGFLGGYFYVGSNVIVMNRNPLNRIKETRPDMYKPYVFHVLLHEYLHTLNYLDEGVVAATALKITEELFGPDHMASRIARNTRRFFPNLVYPEAGWKPDDLELEFVRDFDRSSVNYIA